MKRRSKTGGNVICDVSFGILALFRDGAFQIAALKNPPPAFAALRRREPIFRPEPSNPLARVAASKKLLHIEDIAEDEAYRAREPATVLFVESAKVQTLLVVPMLKEAELVGTIGVFRQEKRPFTDKQIGLLSNFATQAVIAVDNARLLNELRQRTAELSDALEQQTATSDVLKIVSSSRGELQPVFDAMLANATRLCGASYGTMWLHENQGQMHMAARHGPLPEAFSEKWRVGTLFSPSPSVPTARVFDTQQPVQVRDLKKDRAYSERDPLAVASVDVAGIRSLVAVPMLKDGVTIGAITVYRQEVRPFTDKQIELVKNFAAQAVIAIENARLLTELRKSLQQQTATADVLKVISRSTFDLQTVLDTLVESAARLCAVDQSVIFLRDGEVLRLRASFGFPPEAVAYALAHPMLPNRGSATGRVALEGRPVHVKDVLADPEYSVTDYQQRFGYRTVLCVPLLREGSTIGVFALTRDVVAPFNGKQIELATTFADQAVIAIENARLLNDLRQRTDDLTESLEQQTATSKVLEVISRSALDLRAVFETVAESSVRLCGADRAFIFRFDGALLRMAVAYNSPPDFTAWVEQHPIRPGRHSGSARAALERRTIHIPDVRADPEYTYGAKEVEAIRTVLGVPILKGDALLGVMMIYHLEGVRPFTEKQIALVETFADQAAIAIENARLFEAEQQRTHELAESLHRQTATADVLKVISRSTFDLQPVLDTLVESVTRLCEAKDAFIFLRKGELYHVAARYGFSRGFHEYLGQHPRPVDRASITGRTALEGKVVHVADVTVDPEYNWNEAQQIGGYRTVLGVPLLRDGSPVGVIIVGRSEVRPFTDKQIELVTTFADQAVIAIENVRLFDEVQARTGELSRSVQELRALGEVSQAVNSTLDLETVLSTIVAKAVQLSGTEAGAIYVFDHGQREFHLRATYGMDQELVDALTHQRIGLDEPNIELALARSEPIQVADLREEAPSDINEITLHAGYRARLVAPLLRGNEVVGLLVVRRRTPGTFPQNTVDLIKTFAAQSVLAIQNARLFDNVELARGNLRGR